MSPMQVHSRPDAHWIAAVFSARHCPPSTMGAALHELLHVATGRLFLHAGLAWAAHQSSQALPRPPSLAPPPHETAASAAASERPTPAIHVVKLAARSIVSSSIAIHSR